MIFLIYILGVIVSLGLSIKLTLKEEGEIKLSDIRWMVFCLFSWFMVIAILFSYLDVHKDKVIYKSKSKKDGLGKN